MADEKDLSKDTEEVTQESETVTPEKGAKTAKSDKDAKADTAKKKGPGLGKRIAKYFRDVKGEFKNHLADAAHGGAQHGRDPGDVRRFGPGHLRHRLWTGRSGQSLGERRLIPMRLLDKMRMEDWR